MMWIFAGIALLSGAAWVILTFRIRYLDRQIAHLKQSRRAQQHQLRRLIEMNERLWNAGASGDDND